MDDQKLSKLFWRRNEIEGQMRDLQVEKRTIEEKTMEFLVENRLFGCFNINWSRVRRLLRDN